MTLMTKNGPLLPLLSALILMLIASACAPGRYATRMSGPAAYSGPVAHERQSGQRPRTGYVKDNKPSIWITDHPRVARYYRHYSRTTTVETALRRGRRYLPTITRVFRQRGLPLELAYLPMLESMFVNTADSGSARGLWQFTRGTARTMGLEVGVFADERLNWHKATLAAAAYLDQLGEKFNYNWSLALAAYNGGPGYIERAMKRQHTWDYFRLRLRREVHEYVPRFVAMVQVAKEKYPHLLIAAR